MRSESKPFFSAHLIAQIPIWDVFPVNKDNLLLSVVLWLKYSDTSNSEGWGFLISFFTAQSLIRKCIFMDLEITERHYYQWSYYYVKDSSLRFFPCFNWHWNTVNSLEDKCQGNKCYALLILNALAGIPGWRSGLAPAFGPGRDPGDPGSNPTSGSRCMEPASPSACVSASLSLSLCDYHK